jgi:hypothetical protein
VNIFNIRLLIILYFKKSLLNLKIRTVYIEVFNIFNNFKLELKIKLSKLKK